MPSVLEQFGINIKDVAIVHVKEVASSLLPGAIPSAAGTAVVSVGAGAGAPPWLLALGQALIVALWCSSAMRKMQKGTTDRLDTLEAAVGELDCVKSKRASKLLGTSPAMCKK